MIRCGCNFPVLLKHCGRPAASWSLPHLVPADWKRSAAAHDSLYQVVRNSLTLLTHDCTKMWSCQASNSGIMPCEFFFFFFAWTSVAALISNFTIWNAQGICVIFKLQNTLQTWDWHDLQISASASFSFSSVSHMLFFFFFWWVHKRCLDRNRKASKLLSCLSVLQSWLQP